MIAFLLLLLLASCAPVAPAPAPTPTTTLVPGSRPAMEATLRVIQVKLGRDTPYCSPGGSPLMLDTYYPLKATGLKPLVLYIHGGGWTSGAKYEITGTEAELELSRRGYVVASINYRLAPAHPFPAALADARCALRYLRAHAHDYQVDPARIGVFGDGAGGHIAALLALTHPGPGLDNLVEQWTGADERVQAAALLYAPTDLTRFNPGSRASFWKDVFGASGLSDPILAPFSPVSHVSSASPPFLVVQGKSDPAVPLQSARDFAAKLQESGVPNQLVEVENGGFSFDPVMEGDTRPSTVELAQILGDFFDRYLKDSLAGCSDPQSTMTKFYDASPSAALDFFAPGAALHTWSEGMNGHHLLEHDYRGKDQIAPLLGQVGLRRSSGVSGDPVFHETEFSVSNGALVFYLRPDRKHPDGRPYNPFRITVKFDASCKIKDLQVVELVVWV